MIAALHRVRRTPGPLWALLFGIGCVLIAVAPTSASSGTVLHVGTATLQVGQTATTNVTVSLAGSDSVNAYDLTLSYASDRATATGITVPPGWTTLTSTIDNAVGSLHVAAFQLGAGCGGGTSCALFSVSWSGAAAGTSTLHITAQQLAGSNGGTAGTIASVAAVDGSVIVTGSAASASAIPTNTATPTATASPTATATNTATPTVAPATTTSGATSSPPPDSPTATATPTVATDSSNTTATPAAPSPTGAAVTTPADTLATATPTHAPETVVATTTTRAIAPAVIGTASPAPTRGAPAAASPASALGTKIGDFPKPPATGNAGPSYGTEGNSMRLAGMALIVISLLVLLDRGVRSAPARRLIPLALAVRPGSSRDITPAARMDDRTDINTVVDRYLSAAEQRAMDDDEVRSVLEDDDAGAGPQRPGAG